MSDGQFTLEDVVACLQITLERRDTCIDQVIAELGKLV